jgi:hypothetical protein
MKPGLAALLLMVSTVAAQRLLSLPHAPPWFALVLLPMPWVVGPPLLTDNHRWYVFSFGLGVVWDALFEPVIGPGAISWSAAAAVCWALAGVVVNRGARAWFSFGLLATVVFWAVRALSQSLLGLQLTPNLVSVALSGLASGILCGCVGWTYRIDMPRRWRTFRARRLR